jgi:Family of unknown function (DUF6256)
MSSALLRQDFVPMVAGYLIIMATLALGLHLARRSPARPGSRDATEAGRPAGAAEAGRPSGAVGPGQSAGARISAVSWWRLARHVAGTMVGGYLLLMAVVILYYYLVARVGGAFIKSAFTGCALLIGLVTLVFAAASWLTERHRERRVAESSTTRTGPR